MPVIEVQELSKRYNGRAVVDDVSFTVDDGEIFAIVGPNGAGKTTIVESIVGLRRPDGGRIRVFGLDPQRHGAELRQRVGVQLQESQFPDRIKVWEALDLYSSFYRAPTPWPELIEQLDLTSQRDAWVGNAVGWSAATPVRGSGARRRPAARSARRAHHRARPAGSARHLALRGRDPRRGCHDRARHPFHGGGGIPRRPGGADRPRPTGSDRHTSRTGGASRAGAADPVPALGTDRGCCAARPARGDGNGPERVAGSSSPAPATSCTR